MYRIIKILIVILITLYPFFIYFGLNYFKPAQIALVLLVVFAARLLFVRKSAFVKSWPVLLTVVTGASLALISWLFGEPDYLLWYPTGLNTALFVIFITSLISPPTIIEYMARLTDPHLSERAIRYTRNVTIVWAVFFALNGTFAAWTVLHGDLKLWTLYNGLVAYIMMGLIFAVEFIVRQRVRRNDKPS